MIAWSLVLFTLALEANTNSVSCFSAVPLSLRQASNGGLSHSPSRTRTADAASVAPTGAPTTAVTASSSSTQRSLYRFNDDDNKDNANGSSSSSNGGDDHSSFRNIRSEPQHNSDSNSNFITGDALHRLRHKVLALRLELQQARSNENTNLVTELERSILKAQQSDAEFVYSVSLERMEIAETEGNFAQAARFQLKAKEARLALPQFQLEGLWVGKYNGDDGDSSYEMINVTYAGDVMVAHKVTGTKNVPKGEASFQVNLGPGGSSTPSAADHSLLTPIELGENAATQWGSKFLQRFLGEGQVAAEGYRDSQWIDGQLILINDFYFSFAWLPIGHQVFFGRPTAELVLKLMHQEGVHEPDYDEDDEDSTADLSTRSFLEKCWVETVDREEQEETANAKKQQKDSTITPPVKSPTFIEFGEGCFE